MKENQGKLSLSLCPCLRQCLCSHHAAYLVALDVPTISYSLLYYREAFQPLSIKLSVGCAGLPRTPIPDRLQIMTPFILDIKRCQPLDDGHSMPCVVGLTHLLRVIHHHQIARLPWPWQFLFFLS